MAFTLPPLPYDFAALEPHIDAKTMEIHHGKHHQTYVNNLNAAIEKAPELAGKSLDESTAAEAGRLALTGAAPLPDTTYKLRLAAGLVGRALLEAAG